MRDLGAHELGDPEVRDLDPLTLVQDQVRRLDVAVDDALAVRVVHRGGDLADEADDLLGREADPPLQDGGDRLALHELHGQIGDARLLADVEEGDDVGVGQGAGDPGLVVEALDEGLVLRALARDVEPDRLDGQGPLDERVEGLVDRAHRAVADAVLDLVAPDGLGDLLGRTRGLIHVRCAPLFLSPKRRAVLRLRFEGL